MILQLPALAAASPSAAGLRGVLTHLYSPLPCQQVLRPVPCRCLQHDFFLTLEEVYHGVMKQVTHTRRVLQPDGATEVQERELTIDVSEDAPLRTAWA